MPEPRRVKDLTDIADPIATWSRIEIDDPSRCMPYKLKLEPVFTKDRRDNEDPTLTKSHADILDPK
jgi:hypothetical protein